jgi:hypothetical protein
MKHNTAVGNGIRCKFTRGISEGKHRLPVVRSFNLKTGRKRRLLSDDGRASDPVWDWIGWYIGGVGVVIYSGVMERAFVLIVERCDCVNVQWG